MRLASPCTCDLSLRAGRRRQRHVEHHDQLLPLVGRHLPESQRDLWFDELERRGTDPREDEVPAEFRDDRWLAFLHREQRTSSPEPLLEHPQPH
ncbi:DUF6980 family protein [Streptomyces viridosporus]|uniref:DUF6980 family protein n=1 Tax=Streptomyces viridosporus TaxID=67581 RepID=UPI003F4D68F3